MAFKSCAHSSHVLCGFLTTSFVSLTKQEFPNNRNGPILVLILLRLALGELQEKVSERIGS